MSRRVAINLVAFVGVFVLMLWWAVNNIISFDFIERPYEISGEFAATAGVATNSEVAYLGVNHGAVRSVESVDGVQQLLVRLVEPMRGVAPGQTVVLYQDTRVLGQATIDAARSALRPELAAAG